ncbi:hypothetical protein K7I13_05510 [Brucepastera parasyntrophica]|uniref:hypothetical protein n=1 Tax=Brucepastera parasyntrophica TaxID=2880008 RepID=UPI00210B3649|nr:hypothetical protein [Brucepastera parasyntrophica]ULQ60728.1 hypothetical protein K7I13_05510 [Brucepastera parasyntrophica]
MFRKSFVFAVLLLSIATLSAQNWTAGDVAETRNETVTVLAGDGGKSARVISAGPLAEDDIRLIGNCLDTVWAIPGLEGTDASVRIEDNGFRLVIYPVSFVYNRENFAPRLPSGLSFYYRNSLFYDVTLKVDSYMPKVTGAYVSPEGFLKSLYGALVVPEMYMYDESLLKRVERIENALIAVVNKTSPQPVNEDLVLDVISLYNENSKITPAQVVTALKRRGIKTSVKEVKAIFIVMLGKYD